MSRPKFKKKKSSSPFFRILGLATAGAVVIFLVSVSVIDPAERKSVSLQEVQIFRNYEERLNDQPLSDEVQKAKDDYMTAFDRYTQMATGELEGNITEAKREYEENYRTFLALTKTEPANQDEVNFEISDKYYLASPLEALTQYYLYHESGNVHGMIGCLSDKYLTPALKNQNYKNLTLLVKEVSIETPQLEVVAESRINNGKIAVIRYIYDLPMKVRGAPTYQTGGSLAIVEKNNEGWQLAGIVPDQNLTVEVIARGYRIDPSGVSSFNDYCDEQDLRYSLGLNYQEDLLRERSLGTASMPVQFASFNTNEFDFTQSNQPQEDLIIELQQLRKAIFQLRQDKKKKQILHSKLGDVYVNEDDLVKDVSSSLIGLKNNLDEVPVAYTFYERFKTLVRDLPNDWDRGDNRAVVLDIALVMWGSIQLFAESSTFLGTLTDIVESNIEQIRYNHIQRVAYAKLWLYINSVDIGVVTKYPILLPDQRVERGVDYDFQAPKYANEQSRLVNQFRLLSDQFYRKQIPLKFVMGFELNINKSESETFYNAARQLGAQSTTHWDWDDREQSVSIPVKVHNLRNATMTPVLVGELGGFSFVEKVELTENDVIIIHAGCGVGTENLSITLNTGQKVSGIHFANTVYNSIVSIQALGKEYLEVDEGGEVLAKLYGLPPLELMDKITPPDLSGLPCINISVNKDLDVNPGISEPIVSVTPFGTYPNAKLRIQGLKEGQAWIWLDFVCKDHRGEVRGTGFPGFGTKLVVKVNAEQKAKGVICTYFEKEVNAKGWDGELGMWVKRESQETGKTGYIFQDENGTPDPGSNVKEEIWTEAYFGFIYPGITRNEFPDWVNREFKVEPGFEGKYTKSSSQVTVDGRIAQVIDYLVTLPSYVKKNESIDNTYYTWEGSHSEIVRTIGVEGIPGAKLAIITTTMSAGTRFPSSIGSNVEKAMFKKLEEETMNILTNLNVRIEQNCTDISF